MAAYHKMTYQDACEVLQNSSYGILSVTESGGMPYGVPLSYVVEGNRLYFHGKPTGKKAGILCTHPRAAFTVVEQAEADPTHYTMLYRSIMAFGEVHPVTDEAEKRAALTALCQKYGAPTDPIHINAGLPHTAVWRMDVEYVSGRTNE